VQTHEKFESASAKRGFYKRNAATWYKFIKDVEKATADMEELELKLLADETIDGEKAMCLFETKLKAYDPENKDFKYYLRPMVEEKIRSGGNSKAIILAAKCPKVDKVGFAHADANDEAATGNFIEPFIYSFLKGSHHYSL
jgi:hypothetical protein